MAATATIREHMKVFGSCGNRLGVVDRIEDGSIRLTTSKPGVGEPRYIPLSWVETVSQFVILNKSCREAREEWEPEPIGVWG